MLECTGKNVCVCVLVGGEFTPDLNIWNTETRMLL